MVCIDQKLNNKGCNYSDCRDKILIMSYQMLWNILQYLLQKSVSRHILNLGLFKPKISLIWLNFHGSKNFKWACTLSFLLINNTGKWIKWRAELTEIYWMTSVFATIDAEISFAGSTAYSARTFLMALVWIDGRDKLSRITKIKDNENYDKKETESQTHKCL